MSNNIFGLHEKALMLREQRAQVLANNLVNASTPGFKARDLDFKAALESEQQNNGGGLLKTDSHHLALQGTQTDAEYKYRVAFQASSDGNTVDSNIEQTQFAENALRYKSTLTFIRQQARMLSMAIRGE